MVCLCPNCGEVLIKQSSEEWYCPECNEIFYDEELEEYNSFDNENEDEDW